MSNRATTATPEKYGLRSITWYGTIAQTTWFEGRGSAA